MLEGYVEMIYHNKPNHPKQKYRLTAKGIALKIAQQAISKLAQPVIKYRKSAAFAYYMIG